MTDQSGPQWGSPPGWHPQGPPAQKHPKRKKWPFVVGGVALALVVLGIIGSISDGSETTTAAATSTTVVPTTTTAAPTTTTTAPTTTTTVPVTTIAAQVPPPAGQVRVPMPNVVCKNLQVAQDIIQAAGVFYSRSTDATGAGRMQVLDRNWVVVGQTPAPGVLIGEGDAVLSVVKLTESNPC